MKRIYFTTVLLIITLTTFANYAHNSHPAIENEGEEDIVCLAVDLFYAFNITLNSADIGWNPSGEAIEYRVNYRSLDDTSWNSVSIADDSLTSLYVLDTCQGYEFFITTVCSDFSEIESSLDTFYTLCDTIISATGDIRFTGDLVIYPNPTTGELNIQFNEPINDLVYVKIYNSSGVMKDEKSFMVNGESELKNLLFLNLTPGLNYVSITYNGNVYKRQVISYR